MDKVFVISHFAGNSIKDAIQRMFESVDSYQAISEDCSNIFQPNVPKCRVKPLEDIAHVTWADIKEVIDTLYVEPGENNTASHQLFWSPAFPNFLDDLYAAFPNAKYVFLTQDKETAIAGYLDNYQHHNYEYADRIISSQKVKIDEFFTAQGVTPDWINVDTESVSLDSNGSVSSSANSSSDTTRTASMTTLGFKS